MKRILTIMAMSLALIAATTSCKDTKPDFKFALEVTGDLANAHSEIIATFDATTTNLGDAVTVRTLVVTPDVTTQDKARLEADIERYLKQNFIAEFGPNTLYRIDVIGYVREAHSGITIAINKRYTNYPNQPAVQDIPIILDEVPDDRCEG